MRSFARVSPKRASRRTMPTRLSPLSSEAIQARRIVATRGASAKTARYLYGKGFSEDVVSGAVADGADRELG